VLLRADFCGQSFFCRVISLKPRKEHKVVVFVGVVDVESNLN